MYNFKRGPRKSNPNRKNSNFFSVSKSHPRTSKDDQANWIQIGQLQNFEVTAFSRGPSKPNANRQTSKWVKSSKSQPITSKNKNKHDRNLSSLHCWKKTILSSHCWCRGWIDVSVAVSFLQGQVPNLSPNLAAVEIDLWAPYWQTEHQFTVLPQVWCGSKLYG
jgi:hypothetical protein